MTNKVGVHGRGLRGTQSRLVTPRRTNTAKIPPPPLFSLLQLNNSKIWKKCIGNPYLIWTLSGKCSGHQFPPWTLYFVFYWKERKTISKMDIIKVLVLVRMKYCLNRNFLAALDTSIGDLVTQPVSQSVNHFWLLRLQSTADPSYTCNLVDNWSWGWGWKI